MTTLINITNHANSNGDAHIDVKCGESSTGHILTPGKSLDQWISTDHELKITETWPTDHQASEHVKFGALARTLISGEIAKQSRMWGDERDDYDDNQLLGAAIAHAEAVANSRGITSPLDRACVFRESRDNNYPVDWDQNAFRDYGSDIANLVVAAAFLENEIKRRLIAGESYERSERPKNQPYLTVTPGDNV